MSVAWLHQQVDATNGAIREPDTKMEDSNMFTQEMIDKMTAEQMEALATALRAKIDATAQSKIARIQTIRVEIQTLNSELADLRLWCHKNNVTIPREKSETPEVDKIEEKSKGKSKKTA